MFKYLLLVFITSSAALDAQIITTVAGGGTGGDGVPATAAIIVAPEQVTIDKYGNIYFSEILNHRIRKVDTSGIISTVAGTGSAGYNGDGGLATATMLNLPSGITTDTFGNVYFCDQTNNRIRKINVLTGIITTVVGNGTSGFSGDNGPATAAAIKSPYGVYFRSNGELYVCDNANYRVRKVNTSGVISTVVGNGLAGGGGDGGLATAAQCSPTHVCFDFAGNMYITDEPTYRVRKVSPSGIISTVAGNSSSYTYNGDEIPATNAHISPTYIAIGIDGLLYIPDFVNNRVRQVDGNGIIHTIAGDGSATTGGDGGPATNAQIYRPISVAFDLCGNLFISQMQNPRIRKVTYNPTPCPHLGVEEKDMQAITIYPNPVTDELHIEGVTTSSEYMILNVTGIIEQQGTLEKGSNTLTLKTLPPGVYILRLTSEDYKRTFYRFTKQ